MICARRPIVPEVVEQLAMQMLNVDNPDYFPAIIVEVKLPQGFA